MGTTTVLLHHMIGHTAQIREYSNCLNAVTQNKLGRLAGIMRNTDRVHRHTVKVKSTVPIERNTRCTAQITLESAIGRMHRYRVLMRQGCYAANVIGMFMADQDSIQIAATETQTGQASFGLF